MYRNGINYRKRCEEEIRKARGGSGKPTLLLQACCAPCSSTCLEFLREFFRVTVFYYNPNITESAEYAHRKEEAQRLISVYNGQVESGAYREIPPVTDPAADIAPAPDGMHSTAAAQEIGFLEAPYDPETFLAESCGLEEVPEGGERCFRCYELRLRRTAEAAKAGGFDYFATTLTLSPLKSAAKLNEIGERIAEETGTRYLDSDFKKKNGYPRSIELSEKFGLYRQDYCGCGFSKAQREREKRETKVQ